MGTQARNALHTVAAIGNPEGYLRWRAAHDGDPFRVRFPGLPPVWFTGHPDGAREIFRAPLESLEPPTPNPIAPLVGSSSLILLSGAAHQHVRKLLGPAFHRAQIRGYADIIAAAARAETARWRPGGRVEVGAAARSITLRVILEAVLGVDDARRRAEYVGAVSELLNAYTGPLMFLPPLRQRFFGRSGWDRFCRARDSLNGLLDADLAQRRPATAGRDIASSLLAAGAARPELRAQLVTLLIAGHETTATAVGWALYRLHRDPLLLDRVRGELDQHVDSVQPAQLADLPLLGAVCDEALRLHPPVPIVLRQLTEPLEVRGQRIPAGHVAGVALPLLHTDPAAWGSDAAAFNPDRFDTERATPFEFAPFGGGHRRCIGATLAEYEMRIVVATILSQSRLALPAPDRVRPIPPAVPHGIATRSRRPLLLDVMSLQTAG
ncbi:cytochrome P450 [Skermania sp. ID1734]|nr:cytochrome P450 [Skermania sp. ID1734]